MMMPQIKSTLVLKSLCFCLLVLPLLFLTGNSQNLPPNCSQEAHEKQIDALLQKSGLTAQQLQKVRVLRQKRKSEAEGLNKALAEKQKALHQYLNSPEATEAKAQALETDISNLGSQLNHNRISTSFKIRQVFSKDQLKKFLVYRSQLQKDPQYQRCKESLNGYYNPNH
jgi:Spy/CpxP family protein refolding chaperone